MIRASEATNSDEKIRSSMISKNNQPAPLAILRKDHKQYDSEEIGPPGRPVCGGDVSYNKRLSHLISKLLTDLYMSERSVCLSTEGLLAEVDKLNHEGLDDDDIVGSGDVEALYPSLDIEFTVDKVCEMFLGSTVSIKDINLEELTLYLSLNKTEDQLKAADVYQYCPRRKNKRGPRPNMTGCGMKEKESERHKPWIFPDISNIDEKTEKKLITEAIRVVLLELLRTHTYEFAGCVRRQCGGGPIGMELTGVVAQVFMTWWDRELQRKLNEINFQLRMHQRYVDDTNVAAKQSEVGARYDGEKIIIHEASIEDDEGVPPDERTMRLLQQFASSIHPSIRLTIDYPSKNSDGKVAMLDLKMWIMEVDGVKRLVHEHYEKDMASKMVVHARSSLSEKTKMTILRQEGDFPQALH